MIVVLFFYNIVGNLNLFSSEYNLEIVIKWFDYGKSALKRRNMPFTSNIFSVWNTLFKNRNENNKGKYSIYPKSPLTSIVSTRGHFDLQNGKLSTFHSIEDYNHTHVPGFGGYVLENNELALYIHGVWAGQTSAIEQTNRVKLSLKANRYNIPVMGFSWDSNTAINPSGWEIAKSIANQNGPKLAKFISDFKGAYPDCNIRVIAHSLGAKVVESALISLFSKKQRSNNSSAHDITSVHLIGAAISDDAVSKNQPCGIAIENTVNRFYNLYNPEDNALKGAYVLTEKRNPLGLLGLKKGVPYAINYEERNVKFEIPPFTKASGIYQTFCDKGVNDWGDNHCGYIGFRETYPFNKVLKDDGAVNIIVGDWRDTSK